MGPGFRMGRRRGLIVGAAVGAGVANRRKNNAAAAQAADDQSTAAQAPVDTGHQIEELEKLGQLKQQGILTQEEFDAKKKQILGQ